MLKKTPFLLVAAICLMALPALADSPAVDLSNHGGGLSWSTDFAYATATLTISGPDGFHARHVFTGAETPSFDALGLADGSHTWELVMVSPVSAAARERLRAVRAAGDERAPTNLGIASHVASGYFLVLGGEVITPEVDVAERAEKPAAAETPASALGESRAPTKDQLIADDLIVTGSICVGFDCVNGETFGFDTLKLKENNLRIKFDDTSNSGSFPSFDWQLTANDSANGGANKFSIDDITSGRTPFTIEGSAPSHSLYVDDAGNLGLGTSTPVVEVHVKDGDSPTLRLEQDGSSGFTAQTWDVAGNEANFFVRDVTNGSRLPFKIVPNAPTNSLYVAASGNVGIGTTSPGARFEVSSSGTEAKLQMENTTSGTEWFLQVEQETTDGLLFSQAGTGGVEMELNQRLDGNSENAPTLEVFGSIRATNVMFTSSREAKTDFAAVDPRDVLDRLTAIPVQTWRYKTDKGAARHMGPVAEDFAAAFGLGRDDETITSSDIDGVALASIQALAQRLEALETENAGLRERIEELEATP